MAWAKSFRPGQRSAEVWLKKGIQKGILERDIKWEPQPIHGTLIIVHLCSYITVDIIYICIHIHVYIYVVLKLSRYHLSI
jgi:hypothetical protein